MNKVESVVFLLTFYFAYHLYYLFTFQLKIVNYDKIITKNYETLFFCAYIEIKKYAIFVGVIKFN